MYGSVLIPTDGSDPAERAARQGVALADAYDASVHALSVVDERDYDTAVVDGETIVAEGRESAEREARRAVEAVADLVPDGDVTTRIEVGVPPDAILDYVSSAGIDVVVVGTHGRTGIERFVIGSVAEKVVRLADVPVVTVRAAEFAPTWPPVDRVLFPTDGSDGSYSALPYAFDLADRFDAVVEGLYVIDERTKSNYYNVATALEDVVGGLQAAGERAARHVEREGRDRGIETTAEIVEGVPSETICSYADRSGADVVVMSTHGRTDLARFLLGSVTERVVRNAKPPVLTTPIRDARRDIGRGGRSTGD